MRRALTILPVLFLALGVGVAFGADVSGKWTGELAGPDGGGMTITFDFKQDGAKLTGTAQGPQGDAIEIQDGKVDGDKISFTVIVGDGAMKITHDGTVKGDEITLNVKMDGGPGGGPIGPMTLKRVK
jgi:hypothetical protein